MVFEMVEVQVSTAWRISANLLLLFMEAL